jgi:sortase B
MRCAAPRRPADGRCLLLTKIAIAVTAILLGFMLVFVGAFVWLPRFISENIKDPAEDVALTLYDRTLKTMPAAASAPPEPAGQMAFVQPAPLEEGIPEVAAPKETAPEEVPAFQFPRDSFADVLELNEDVVGRISMDAANIHYLVVQGDDNEYYLRRGYDRKTTRSGAIFLDYRCTIGPEPLKGHLILYGHNMKKGTMFHNLMKYKDEQFFLENRIFRFDTLYADHEWEIFSAYVTDTSFYYIDTTFKDDAEWLSFLQTIQSKSFFPTDTVLMADDVVLTLSTCTYEFDDARFSVHARLIK